MRPGWIRIIERMDNEDREEDQINKAVRRVLKGNSAAFRTIVDQYQDMIFRTAYSFLGNRADAKDAVQDVFLRVYRRLSSYDPRYPFRPWLYKVAVNQIRTSYGRMKRISGKETQSDDIIDQDEKFSGKISEPLDSLVESEQKERINQAVSHLKEPVKTAVILYYFEGLTVDETADVLKVSRENIKSKLHRGRKKIRDFFSENAT
jgi:RNA polymerase sigma-70 factor (ECF subfamily)